MPILVMIELSCGSEGVKKDIWDLFQTSWLHGMNHK